MNKLLLLLLTIFGLVSVPSFSDGQVPGDYQVLKTNSAYVIKTKSIDYTRIDTERLTLDCSSTELSKELNFDLIAHYFDEETKSLFRNIKIQSRVYIDIRGDVQELYFICEQDPEELAVDFRKLEEVIRRKMKVEENKDCLTKFEDKFISWYIPLYNY
ncbi:hypothetical protein SAMN04488057_107116 [Cyclobacterium lianum]|uniref:Uncharacterized protein n=1 Tax=Cyclobacterium lianum TaxID=388280 RepID=A0A1M7P832_9BACT|nr:hypothetical protein [Cyclobacterium lianum]SHN12799.1 hypothetical protein SAMN04488057_107116 [Cyclobacterium lianum]